ncbi:MAG: ABC transporter ATP-binding protein [Calditrichia bacterium]
MTFEIHADHIGKKFSHGYIFKSVSFNVKSGQVLSIAGHNGSGKTTLLKIIAGLVYPEKGKVSILQNGREISFPYIGVIGLVGPYLEVYDQLTAVENLAFFASQLGCKLQENDFISILDHVGLKGRYNDPVGAFSSGMKQRMKYALLYLKKFPIYMLDEPTSNFDDAGRELFHTFVEEHRESIIIIASNHEEEIELGDIKVELS